jgi:hypothetical protein
VFNTQAFGSFFDAGQLMPEAQAVVGDSGRRRVLAVAPRRVAALGRDHRDRAVLGPAREHVVLRQRTYYADLAYYRSQLLDAIELPEPHGALAAGAALLAGLASRRRAAR